MEVYIEYVIIDNLILDYILLFSTLKIMGIRPKKYMCLIASIFGTTLTVAFPLLCLSMIVSVFIKLFTGVMMLLLVHQYKSLKEFFYCFSVFLGLTFVLGGACYGVINLMGGSVENFVSGKYDSIIPVSIIIFISFVYVLIIITLTKYIYRRKDMKSFITPVTLSIAGKIINLTGFVDSGNRLYDPETGRPIIVVSVYALEKHFSADEIASLMFLEETSVFGKPRSITYSTVDGTTKKMIVFDAKETMLGSGNDCRKLDNVVVGVTFKKFNDAINYDVLLHPQIV